MTPTNAKDAINELLSEKGIEFDLYAYDKLSRNARDFGNPVMIELQFQTPAECEKARQLLMKCTPLEGGEIGSLKLTIQLVDVNRECIEELLGAARKYHPEPKVSCDEVRNIQDALCHANPGEFDSRDLWIRLENGNYSNASDIEDAERLFWRVREAIAAGRPCAVVNATATVLK